MEKNIRELFMEKLWNNYREYIGKWSKSTRREMIENAEKVTSIRITAKMLEGWKSEDDMKYLLRFKNPLEVVSDYWFAGINFENMEISKDFEQIVFELRDTGNAEGDYELDSDYMREDIKEVIDEILDRKLGKQEGSSWIISWDDINTNLDISVSKANGIDRMIVDELKSREMVKELIVTEDGIEMSVRLTSSENVGRGDGMSARESSLVESVEVDEPEETSGMTQMM